MAYFKHDKALVADGAKIGDGTRIWAFANIQDGAVIGRDCNICDNCYVEKGAVIGDHVTIKNGVCVWEGVTLENGVFAGPNVAFVNDRYPKSRKPWTMERILVKAGASLGANATILCGITIGEGALVGAGAVVVRDVAARTIVVGNPARKVGVVDENGKPVKDAGNA
jgi:UDP-2-acetamido-3-amino-2,3-dideoxy-glucuronate N-acetyltransferase